MSNMIVMFDIILYQILLPSDLHPSFKKMKNSIIFFVAKTFRVFTVVSFLCYSSCGSIRVKTVTFCVHSF